MMLRRFTARCCLAAVAFLAACVVEKEKPLDLTKPRKLIEEQDYEQAIQALDQAEKHFPQSDSVYYYRGLSHAMLDHYTQALADFDSALHHNPGMPDAHFMKGSILLAKGDKISGCVELELARENGHPKASEEMEKHGCVKIDKPKQDAE